MIVKTISAGILGGISILLALVGGGHAYGAELLTFQQMLMSISIWEALQIISTIVVPFLILTLTALGKLVWNLYKRLKVLENSQKQQGKTLYGDSDDKMHDGLSKEVLDLKHEMEEIRQILDEISRKINK